MRENDCSVGVHLWLIIFYPESVGCYLLSLLCMYQRELEKEQVISSLLSLPGVFILTGNDSSLSFPGIFTFESASQRVSESVGVMEVKVLRTSGARGLVAVPYRTLDGTARGGEDYELVAGKLEFQNDETM